MLEITATRGLELRAGIAAAHPSDGEVEALLQLAMLPVWITAGVAVRWGVFLPLELLRWIRRGLGGSAIPEESPVISLDLAALPQPPASRTLNLDSLCATCEFAHTITGFNPGEQLVTCAYSLPPQFIVFKVKECTDYKQKRERIGVGIAIEGAVSHPHFEQQAADSCAAAAVSPSARE